MIHSCIILPIEYILPPDVLKILYPTFNVLLKILSNVVWRDGKEADSTYCLCRRPGFCFCTHTAAHNLIQLCFQGILIPSFGLCIFCTVYINICRKINKYDYYQIYLQTTQHYRVCK